MPYIETNVPYSPAVPQPVVFPRGSSLYVCKRLVKGHPPSVLVPVSAGFEINVHQWKHGCIKCGMIMW